MPIQFYGIQKLTLKNLLEKFQAAGGNPHYEPFLMYLRQGCAVCGGDRSAHADDKCLFDPTSFTPIPREVVHGFESWWATNADQAIWSAPLGSFKVGLASQVDGVEMVSWAGNPGTRTGPYGTSAESRPPRQDV